MIKFIYAPSFIKKLNKIEASLKEEVLEKVDLFKDNTNHKYLKVHKLHGKFINFFSFSVNYKTRIVFQYMAKDEIALLSIGDHDSYR